jgi:hypothetical protein
LVALAAFAFTLRGFFPLANLEIDKSWWYEAFKGM